MTALLASVFVASVLGSVHCVAMCGGLALLAGQGGDAGLLVRYNMARLASYALFGFTAGAIGHGVDDLAAVVGFEKMAAVLLLTLGVMVMVRHFAASTWSGLSVFRRLLRTQESANARAVILGVITALVPCGWLYAFVATAAATGSPWKGMAVMAAFGVGSTPALLGITKAVRLLERFAPHRRRLAYAIVMVVGVVTIAARSSSLVRLHRSAAEQATVATPQLVCHGGRS